MGAEKTVNSKLTFTFDNQGLIEEHLEEWDHESNKRVATGTLEGFRIQEEARCQDGRDSAK